MAPLPQLTSRDRRALRVHVLRELDRMDEELAAADAASGKSGLIEALRAERDEMRRTLDRLDDLAYGVCETCHAFIGIERLTALPTATRCIRCTS